MRKATMLLFVAALMLIATTSFAQDTDYSYAPELSADSLQPYSAGVHSGARGVNGPYDLDGDGLMEVIVTDYTGGGRVHVIENVSAGVWEYVWSTPYLDATSTSFNGRFAVGGDLDGDGKGEVIINRGRSYADEEAVLGFYVYEFTGTDNDYGTEEASIIVLESQPSRFLTEFYSVKDVDGDGKDEFLLSNNGSNNLYDAWYVYSVNGDIGSGFESWVEEARWTTRSDTVDAVNRGGGSAYAIIPADLDGDGSYEFSMHSWNGLNFSNADVTGADAYAAPAEGDEGVYIHAGSGDHVALFGGTAVDINGDGDDEVFYTSLQEAKLYVLNYEDGENPMQIADTNIVGIIEGFPNLGITSGDFDGDGNMEIIGSGTGYSGGEEANYLSFAEYNGGDVEDGNSYYQWTTNLISDADASLITTVYRDSAGTATVYTESGAAGAAFVSKLAYLGDADGDGDNEIAIAMQSIQDSVYVYDEVWNADSTRFDRTTRSVEVNPNRTFMRIISAGTLVSVEDSRIVLPTDYKLSSNYPNPFNPTTSFSFTLPLDKSVSVKIYDVTGRLVRTLVNNQHHQAGTYNLTWDATNDAGIQAASGTYIYSLEYGNFRVSKTMVLVK